MKLSLLTAFSLIVSSISALESVDENYFNDRLLETQVLFVLCEQKETEALLPVIQAMEKEGRDYRVLSAGPSRAYFHSPSLVSRCLFLKGEIDDTNEISKDQVAAIVDFIQPRVVLSGNSSLVQKQLLDGFKDKAATIVYRDRIQLPSNTLELQVESSAKKVFTVSKTDVSTHVVGNPYIEDLRDKILKCNRQALLEKLGLDRLGGQFVGIMDAKGMSIFPLEDDGAWKCALDDKEIYMRIADIVSSWPLEEQIAIVDVFVSCDEKLLLAASGAGKRVLMWDCSEEPWTGELPQEQPDRFSWEELGIPDNSVEIFLEEFEKASS